MSGPLDGRRVRAHVGWRIDAHIHCAHAGRLAAVPTTIHDAPPLIIVRATCSSDHPRSQSKLAGKASELSRTAHTVPAAMRTELGAASAAASDKLRSHFTGAECAIGTSIDMAALSSNGAEFGVFRHKRPLRATELTSRRSRGAIGRVRAAPGALPTAGRSVDGAEGARTDIPGTGKGLKW